MAAYQKEKLGKEISKLAFKIIYRMRYMCLGLSHLLEIIWYKVLPLANGASSTLAPKATCSIKMILILKTYKAKNFVETRKGLGCSQQRRETDTQPAGQNLSNLRS